MSATVHELLEKHFETAFAAPDGIAKLRELILTLAMQGKLVEQDPNDPPARELLKEIEAEKQRLVKEGKIKKPKKLPPIKPEEVPYELPQGWEWVRLNDALDVRDGTHDTPEYVGVGYPLVTSKNLYTGTLCLDNVKYISKEDYEKIAERSKVDKGDILFAMIGSIGNPVIVDTIFEFSIKNVALFKYFLNGKPYNRYLYYYLFHAQDNMKSISSGAVQRFVSLGFLRNYPFPLPPLPEQHRIVKRIDQLMARCDRLEQLRKEREEKRLSVHAAAIKQLLDADPSFPRRRESSSSKELDPRLRGGDEKGCGSDGVSVCAWNFLKQHFGELYSVKENVAELRKAILQLAMMGRLVPQDPNDPPASELLKEIEAEKQRLVQEGKIKKPKKLPPIKQEELPYELPQGWEWVRFGDIATIERGGSPRPIKAFLTDDPVGLNWIKIGDTDQGGKYITSTKEKIRPEGLTKTRMVYPGDFLLTNSMSFGRPYITQIEGCIHDGWLRISPPASVDKDYLYHLLSSSFIRQMFEAAAAGAVVLNLNSDKVRGLPIPLPPLPEQHRIVKRIDQLMALCDRLEQQIDAATGKQTELLGAVMAQV